MEYMIRFIQVHETFRLPELEALGELENVKFEVVSYALDVCTPPLPLHPHIKSHSNIPPSHHSASLKSPAMTKQRASSVAPSSQNPSSQSGAPELIIHLCMHR